MIRLVQLLLLAFAFVPASAETLYVLRVFTIPKAEGLELLARNMNDSTLHQLLMEQAKTKPAVLEKLLLAASDQRGKDVELQQADELLYPTEFDPQQLPQRVVIGDGAMIQAIQKFFEKPVPPDPAPPVPPAPTDKPAPPPEPPPVKKRKPVVRPKISGNQDLGIISSISPTAFAMRPVGDHLKLTSESFEPDGISKTMISLDLTQLAGFQTYNGETLAQFSHRSILCSVGLKLGAPCFLGTLSPAQRTGSEFETKQDTVSFAFLTARAVKPSAPSSKTPDDAELSAAFEVISLPKEEASSVVEQGLDNAAFHARLLASIKTGSAKREVFLAGRVGQDPATPLVETQEYLYPTKFDPPQIPQELFIADEDLLADMRAGRRKATATPSAEASPYNGGFGWMTDPTPTAFETRKLGTMLTIEVARDEQNVTISVKPELSRLIGEKRYTGVAQPLIESQFLSTSTTTRIGVPQFLGTLSRPLNTGIDEGNKEDRIWFAFVTVRAVK